jgi:hypothetical protein
MTGNDRAVFYARSETVQNDRAVLYARSETVQNDREKKTFLFFIFSKKTKKLEFVSGQNKAFLQVTRKSVKKKWLSALMGQIFSYQMITDIYWIKTLMVFLKINYK